MQCGMKSSDEVPVNVWFVVCLVVSFLRLCFDSNLENEKHQEMTQNL